MVLIAIYRVIFIAMYLLFGDSVVQQLSARMTDKYSRFNKLIKDTSICAITKLIEKLI